MGKMGFKGRSTTILLLIVVTNIFFTANFGGWAAAAAAAASFPTGSFSTSCNGTKADCFAGEEDEEGAEILRYSVGGRWLLQSPPHITYPVTMDPMQTICPLDQYAACIQKNNAVCKPYQTRCGAGRSVD